MKSFYFISFNRLRDDQMKNQEKNDPTDEDMDIKNLEDNMLGEDFDDLEENIPTLDQDDESDAKFSSIEFLRAIQTGPTFKRPEIEDKINEDYGHLNKSDKEVLDRIDKKERRIREEFVKIKVPSKEENPYFHDIDKDRPRPLDLDNPEQFGRAMSFITHDVEKDEIEELKGIEDISMDFDFTEILKIGRHSKITANGRQFSYSAMVLVGTGTGTAGLGYGIGATVVKSVEDAEKNAMKNLLSIKFFKSNTIGKSFDFKYKKTKLWVRSLPIGYGTLAPPVIRRIIEAFGFEDVSLGWKGSKNIHTRYRIIFKAFMENCESEEEVARKLGRKLFKRNAAFYSTRE